MPNSKPKSSSFLNSYLVPISSSNTCLQIFKLGMLMFSPKIYNLQLIVIKNAISFISIHFALPLSRILIYSEIFFLRQSIKPITYIPSHQNTNCKCMLNPPLCSTHNLPYTHICLTPNTTPFRCKQCPAGYDCLPIANQLQAIRSKVMERQRYRSANQKYPDRADEEEADIVQRVTEEQVLTLELIMKLMTEDKKKNYEGLEKKMQEHKKTLEAYESMEPQIVFLMKLCERDYVRHYLHSLNKAGWQEFKKILERKHERLYLLGVLRKQSEGLISELRASRNFGEGNLITVFGGIVEKFEKSTQNKASTQSSSSKKRSRSYAIM